jgi:hypothetical protein
MINEFPGYVYLGRERWFRRERIEASLLAEYDRLLAAANDNAAAVDMKTGRSFGVAWLDILDRIVEHVTPLLDRAGVLQDRELRSQAERRALNAMLSSRRTRP